MVHSPLFFVPCDTANCYSQVGHAVESHDFLNRRLNGFTDRLAGRVIFIVTYVSLLLCIGWL